jgi:HPt (histidine-containing phosphotransfer) domain-containing protein
MAQISSLPRSTETPAVSRDGFDELREAFQARLKGDRVHFVVLSAALARTDEDPSQIFDDLQYRAHRLRGSAAIFEVTEIAEAATALEQAAAAASVAHADNTDAAVWSALVALVRLMGTLADGHPDGGDAPATAMIARAGSESRAR